ncbi:hypothetical protein M408DRAFT_27712 [Serendipita vermifera MAFF 305830]|uniref:BTB domain-containing protein n=1 Tax=Serendipita vermifera MAFF 305830 TaxID=933852 RepID=A0A0C2W7H6_SERVB|nr:hypothetical protein M408DRAFT_28722 [Serendipita vermifera MAFF 305830]KIM23618.1 hypothetical protein M408DRAFT_27712 [Serendipita vermifera MAFF 305830]
MVDNRCTIIVSNERFDFTRDQLESDPGNYFATYFFGEFAEASQGVRELVVDKDVRLFRLIQAHLRGYEIFPLPDSAIPHYMTKEVAIKNLLTDAQYYCLGGLIEKIKNYALTSSKDGTGGNQGLPLGKRYKFGQWNPGYGVEWRYREISSDGYQLILKELKDRNKIVSSFPPELNPLKFPGFLITCYWIENDDRKLLLVYDGSK